MAGNSIGQFFRVTTFGESHGEELGAIIDGVPPGIVLEKSDLQSELNKRRPGTSPYTSQRKEPDEVKILSGIFNGITTGTSIGLSIKNQDQRSQDYDSIQNIYRPGHADYSYDKKYGHRDYRGGGRSSARETVMRVAAGAVAKKYLYIKHNIKIRGFLSQMGDIVCTFHSWEQTQQNDFFCPDSTKLDALHELIKKLKKTGNSIGAKITIIADNIPTGLGEPVFDKLDADLAHALMSINAVKGVEIGDGCSVITKFGTENRDEITPNGFLTNHSGGILGGISTGQPIIIHLALKPTSSIKIPGRTITKLNKPTTITTKGRHDPCVGIRAIPIAEAMTAIILMDHILRKQAQCGN